MIVSAVVPQTTVDITQGFENVKVNFNILHFFVVPMFELSLIICCFKLIYKENISDDDIVSGFKNYSKVLGASLLVALYTALWSLLIIPIFIKPFSYSMTLRIIKDNPDIKVNEAITKSRELMDGHKVELFESGPVIHVDASEVIFVYEKVKVGAAEIAVLDYLIFGNHVLMSKIEVIAVLTQGRSHFRALQQINIYLNAGMFFQKLLEADGKVA